MFSIDVVFEILILLPTKSLMRFKCVDRSWNDIFTTPIFINRNMHILNKEKERMVVFDRTRPRFMISAITENDNELELDFPPFLVVVDDNNNINYHNNITEIQISEKNTNKTILNTFYREDDELSEEMFVYPHRNLPPSVELYNLGTNSWTLPYQEDTTLLPSECQHIIPQRDGTLVNGLIAWASKPSNQQILLPKSCYQMLHAVVV
ncbi:hypothetical protein RIF29_09524 [Crotalaria pallida]|uniref:F-box domain-containing protein n=1 Tax=Crotalaria pallida TaxID=3830 RepID=A0AAN9IHY1_CROPI